MQPLPYEKLLKQKEGKVVEPPKDVVPSRTVPELGQEPYDRRVKSPTGGGTRFPPRGM